MCKTSNQHMMECILLFTILGLSQGFLVFDPELLKLSNKLNVSDLEDSEFYPLSNRKPVNEGPLPDFIDWRDRKVVTPVKNQLKCNACWAFSIVAAVESHAAILSGVTEILSEQFLIDCDPRNTGCTKASLLDSYAHIVNQIGGVLRQRDYFPYVSRQSACRWKPPGKNSILPLSYRDWITGGNQQISHAYPVQVIGYTRIKNDEDEMADALFRYGPLTAAINSASMAMYKDGEYIDEPTDEQCDPTTPNHSVLIVGYNEYVPTDPNERSVKYWIIKNSWGESWGNNGYYYLVRGRNACGIANDVSLPFVAK